MFTKPASPPLVVVSAQRRAAAKLGLKRTTLLAKMRRLGISRPISQEGTDVFGMAREDLKALLPFHCGVAWDGRFDKGSISASKGVLGAQGATSRRLHRILASAYVWHSEVESSKLKAYCVRQSFDLIGLSDKRSELT